MEIGTEYAETWWGTIALDLIAVHGPKGQSLVYSCPFGWELHTRPDLVSRQWLGRF